MFFILLGALAGLLAGRLEDDPKFWSDALKQFSIVFFAVAVLQLVWDFLGGEPVSMKLEEVERRMSLLSDLLDPRLGIDRIWATRRDWQNDAEEGLLTWHHRVYRAKRVDIMSNTLWNNWFKRPEFVTGFCEALAKPGFRVRLLVYDPESQVARLRERDEEGKVQPREGPPTNEMTSEIRRTIERIERICQDQPETKRRLELRLTTDHVQLAQILRAGDYMLVTHYLSGRTGGDSPTVQIVGPSTRLFDTYEDQFRRMWDRATPAPFQSSGGEASR